MSVPSVTLPDGDRMPVVGFGTGGLDGDSLRNAVGAALEAGYTRFDTAEGYGNESALGAALTNSDSDREELFLASKVLPANLGYESVVDACEASLERLGTDYLDLYLVHWPNPAISMRETFEAMERLVDRGLVRNVGVSNFSPYQLSCARHVSDVPIAIDQIEYHPWRRQPDVVSYCEEVGVPVEAAAPLARTEVFEEPAVRSLAEAYDRTPAQIVLRWAIENDVSVIPGSASPDHVRENVALFDWELEERDRRRLDDIERDRSVYNLSPTDWADDTYGISR